MPKKRTLINKQAFKKSEGKCRVCGETDYALLDTHRLKPGSEGGKYTRFNSVTLCANCHRKVHDEQITLERYCLSSNGTYMLKGVIDGKEVYL